jgi:hypothetical protein
MAAAIRRCEMTRPLAIHLFFMVLGYALAVAVASTITVFITFIPTVLPDDGAWGSAYKSLQELPIFLMFGALYTAMFATPGWLISVITAEYTNERRKYWFGVAGFLTAILAQLIAYAFIGGMFAAPMTLIGSLIGGSAGGVSYWAIVGKRSGGWKSQTNRAVSP